MAKPRKIDYEKIAQNIRLERFKQKMSQDTLGRLSGVSAATIGNIEANSEKALFKNIVSISIALKVDIDEILF